MAETETFFNENVVYLLPDISDEHVYCYNDPVSVAL